MHLLGVAAGKPGERRPGFAAGTALAPVLHALQVRLQLLQFTRYWWALSHQAYFYVNACAFWLRLWQVLLSSAPTRRGRDVYVIYLIVHSKQRALGVR